MTTPLRQSTPVAVRIGPFLDSADGNTEKTALTIAQSDIRLSKAHGAFAQKNDANTCTHDEKGWYACQLNATDTGTLGALVLNCHVSGALDVFHRYVVMEQAKFDALYGTGTLATSPTSNVKKAQALAKFQFVMTDSTNHAPATGKTVSCTRSIDGGAFSAGTLGGSGTATEVANGVYSVDFGSGDLNGNVVTLRCTATGCDDTLVTIITQP